MSGFKKTSERPLTANNQQNRGETDYSNRPPRHDVRYSEMDDARKAELRKQEREFKKSKERTMAYFMSVKRALDELTGSGNIRPGSSVESEENSLLDPREALHSITEGFLTEFKKILKTDLSIFRNSTFCRIMEQVITNATLDHSKIFLMLLLGKVGEIIFSPTSSFVFETALASLYHNMGIIATQSGNSYYYADETEGDDINVILREMASADGTSGTGIPKEIHLLEAIVDEIVQVMDSVIVEIPAARTLKSVMRMLRGEPIRNVPRPDIPAKFPELLDVLCESVIGSIEGMYLQNEGDEQENFRKAKTVISPAQGWHNACCTPSTSIVVQALLESDVHSGIFLHKFDRLYLKGASLLQLLMDDNIGCHVFQVYMQLVISKPEESSPGDQTNDKQHPLQENSYGCWERAFTIFMKSPQLSQVIKSTNTTAVDASYKDHPEAAQQHLDTHSADEKDKSIYKSSGGKRERPSYDSAPEASPVTIANQSTSPIFFVMQDLILYCPSENHLNNDVWVKLIKPHLATLLSSSVYGGLLTKFTRKLAFHGINELESSNNEDLQSSHSGKLEEINVRTDILKHNVSYFPTSSTFREEVCVEFNRVAKEHCGCPKGLGEALLSSSVLGEQHSGSVCYNLLHTGPSASAHLFNSFEKLKVEDLLRSANHPTGSCVLQQYIRNAAARDASMPTAAGEEKKAQKPSLLRLARRFEDHFSDMATKKFSSFVVESIYEHGSVETKEVVINGLMEIYSIIMGTPYTKTTKAPRNKLDTKSHKEHNNEITAQTSITPPNSISKGKGTTLTPPSKDFFSTSHHLEYLARTKEEEIEADKKGVSNSLCDRLDHIGKSTARKVLSKCCVDQYCHRKEDWLKASQNQCSVKKMMAQILAAGERH